MGKSARFGKKWPTVRNSFLTNSRSIYFGPFSTFQFGRCIQLENAIGSKNAFEKSLNQEGNSMRGIVLKDSRL